MIDVPKIIFTPSPAAFETISEASCASNKVKSGPPVMLSRTCLAPSIDTSSNGDEIASLVASTVLFSPLARPIPIKAAP